MEKIRIIAAGLLAFGMAIVGTIWRFLKHLLDPNVVIAMFTAVIATVSYLQWKALIDANKTSDRNLMISQRAYLTMEKAVFERGILLVNLHNSGHVPAKLVSLKMYYGRSDPKSYDFLEYRSKTWTESDLGLQISYNSGGFVPVVPPGDVSGYSIAFRLPALNQHDEQDVATGRQLLHVIGLIVFETGFGDYDDLRVNLVHDKEGWNTRFGGRLEFSFPDVEDVNDVRKRKPNGH